jgi:hypothetical protein
VGPGFGYHATCREGSTVGIKLAPRT